MIFHEVLAIITCVRFKVPLWLWAYIIPGENIELGQVKFITLTSG